MNYRFKFSIIMVIKNIENHIEETLESVINQTIGFEKNIQIILVNCGNNNNVEVYKEYSTKYPRNILYIKKENIGVSSARNIGLEHVKGKYVNFLELDDKLSKETLKNVFTFFEKNKEDIDLVSIPIYLFEAGNRNHILNYKFKNTRIIDIFREYNCVQISASSSFIKENILKNIRFDEKLQHTEEAKLVNEIILKKMKYGVLKEAKYLSRKKENNDFTIQIGTEKLSWYMDPLEFFAKSLMKISKDELGFVPKYIQFVVMYYIQWKIKIPNLNDEIFSKEMKIKYRKKIGSILKDIKSHIIWEQKYLNIFQKKYAFNLKYEKCFFKKQLCGNNLKLYIKDDILINNLNNQTVNIEFMDLKDGKLYLEGNFGSLFSKEEVEIKIKFNNQIYTTERKDRSIYDVICLDETVKSYLGFKCEIPLNDVIKLSHLKILIICNGAEISSRIRYKKFSKLTYELSKSHWKTEKYLISFTERDILIEPKKYKNFLKAEVEYLKQLYEMKEKGAILYRLFYWSLYPFFKNKKIWIFMDRPNKGDDNAEHLFRYVNNQNSKIKKYFIVNKSSHDYKRIKNIGKVIARGSLKHKLIYLFAENMISSHASDWAKNPFFKAERFYRDLKKTKFVFLQHGVTINDVSKMLNKFNINPKLFITTSKYEYNSILAKKYGYTKNEVKLLGLPRYDNLISSNEKQILIMPTWRRNILGKLNKISGEREYINSFKDSDYFKNYNKLINDERLIEKANELGYKIIFAPHPEIWKQLKDFKTNKYVTIIKDIKNYQKLLNGSELLITDYSSIYFDFAYLKKPLFYFQFDKLEFARNQYKKGYFNFEKMGFGDIAEEYEELINKMLNMLDSGCQMESKYKKRVDDFFEYTDKNNCKRVYEAILKTGE